MKEILTHFTAYNFWANKRIIDFTVNLPITLQEKDTQSSFRSINKTLLHLWDAELLWLSRIKGASMDFWPSQQFNEKTSINRLLDVSEQWVKLIESKDHNFLKQACFYKGSNGKETSQNINTIVMHCMNHSTFHRGQIVTMLRSLDIKEGIPVTDMIDFSK
jgi:uncharacterized damage-inducible protein DinB